MWTASRIIALVFTVIEVLLLVRFTFKLLGANAAQAFVSAIYGITEPLVAPFRGIFAQPDGTPVVEIAALLSIVFFVLVAALIVALVRAYTGRRAVANP
jgi:YggT family protein